jgi:AcrR family transcriptional regulator
MYDQPAKRRGRPSAGIREAIVAATLELIEEQGLGGLTTKEVAVRAGASEASVYYHFKDKVGLVQAVIEEGLEPLREIDASMFALIAERPLDEGLDRIAAALERFFTRVMPVFAAIQTNAELRRAFGERMAAQGLGPHRGVAALSAYLADQRERGRVDTDADTEAAAIMLMGACFLRVFNRHMLGTKGGRLPSREQTVQGLARLLARRA